MNKFINRVIKFPIGVKIIGISAITLAFQIITSNSIFHYFQVIISIMTGIHEGRVQILGPRSFCERLCFNFIKPISYIFLILGSLGIFFTKNWARIFLIIFLLLFVVGSLLLMYSKGQTSLTHIGISFLLIIFPALLIIRYLLSKKVKAIF